MTQTVNQRTALYAEHVKAGAKLVPFAGWDMPLHYGSQVQEHHAVRTASGVFDVSHMTVIDIQGSAALAFLQHLLANDAAKLTAAGQAQYGVMLNPEAGIIDDLITYRRANGYRLVVNAGTRDKVIAWLEQQHNQYLQAAKLQAPELSITERAELAMLAIQGPEAVAKFIKVSNMDVSGLASFEFAEYDPASGAQVAATELPGSWMVARTGYTGEDGVEAILPAADAVRLWQALLAEQVQPIGLGARDTLRCEAGLNLYGQDMDDAVNPLIANLAWTIAWQPESRDFVGRTALAAIKAAGVTEKLTGLVLVGKGVIRHGYPVRTAAGDGEVTSGIFSPTLGYSIALARVPKAAKGAVEVEIRGKRVAAKLVKPSFVKLGQPQL